MKINATVVGDKTIIAKLNKFSDEASGKTLENAVTSGALIVQNAAKKNIVAKKVYRTGNLMRSIHIGGHSDQSELANSTGEDIGGNKNTRDSAEVLVGTDVVYAPPHEFGRGNLAARPYLRPAFDENQEKIAKEMGEALKDLLGLR